MVALDCASGPVNRLAVANTPVRPDLHTRRSLAAPRSEWWEIDADALQISGPPILLLDDIYTTGGSLHSLARDLRVAGARSVSAVVLERNLGDDGEWVLPLLRQEVEQGNVWRPEISKKDVIRR